MFGKKSEPEAEKKQGWKLLFDGKVKADKKGAILAAILYVISPIDLIPDVSKFFEDFFLRSSGVCRVFKAPMIAIYHAWKYRAGFVRISTNGDYRVDARIQVLF